jgi:hypothetical protein
MRPSLRSVERFIYLDLADRSIILNLALPQNIGSSLEVHLQVGQLLLVCLDALCEIDKPFQILLFTKED